MRLGIVAHRATPTNLSLAEAAPADVDAIVLPPLAALHVLSPGDIALGRLDIRESLDGVEDGLWYLERLGELGITVLNPPTALRLAHDKLLSATALTSAGLPHPRTVSVRDASAPAPLPFPFVLKPRFGSWGKDVLLCTDCMGWRRALTFLASRAWFSRCGAVAQELVPPLGHDLRILIARGKVIGAIKRVAAPGEWRTNVSLGAIREPTVPPPVACELALSVASTLAGDLVGVDLLPAGPGRYVVLEVNGAVDFTPEYALRGDIFAAATGLLVGRRRLAAIA